MIHIVLCLFICMRLSVIFIWKSPNVRGRLFCNSTVNLKTFISSPTFNLSWLLNDHHVWIFDIQISPSTSSRSGITRHNEKRLNFSYEDTTFYCSSFHYLFLYYSRAGLVVNGFLNVVITTIERRFGLQSRKTGFIASGKFDRYERAKSTTTFDFLTFFFTLLLHPKVTILPTFSAWFPFHTLAVALERRNQNGWAGALWWWD